MGKPFVEVNWMSGFDEKGRPRRIPRTDDTPLMPAAGDLGATNWYPPSYSPNTGLFYVPSLGASSTPRYSAIRALDPRTGEKKWEFRLGGGTGAIFMGGVLTTASDLLFTGIQRGTFYALDARTGQLLWQKGLERIQSGPISYSIGGKQYVAVAAGNTLVSFALKQ
jgi:alcohol dehydrogenase (cytochrome c)